MGKIVKTTVDDGDKAALEKKEAHLKDLLELWTDYEVESDADFTFAGEALREFAADKKEIEKARKTVTDPLNAAIKAFGAFYKPALAYLGQLDVTVRGKVEAYKVEQDRKAAEAIRLTAEHAAAGNYEAAHVASRDIAIAPKLTGVTITESWAFEVTDPSQIPRTFLVVNEAELRRYVSGFKKGEPEAVPGIVCHQDRRA